ncbi:MAG: hypothetical protein OEX77_04900 [Candidatus Bathyarchaeota archaeon]|nr:hypothetical protein [Candidatus Bathyarchaeota archaeon]MDH5733895.1 hypothetical protein [Candidatus Bathyarchaeota archaeon]
MTERIDEILTLLQDGRWHSITEITEKTQLHQTKIELVTSFLEKYDFIRLNKTQQKAKLTLSLHRFIKRIRTLNTNQK